MSTISLGAAALGAISSAQAGLQGTQIGDTSITQQREPGVFGLSRETTNAQVGSNSSFQTQTNGDGSTSIKLKGLDFNVDGSVNVSHDAGWLGDLETDLNQQVTEGKTTTSTDHSSYPPTTTTKTAVDHSSISTTDSKGVFGESSTGKTTVELSARDNYTLNHNDDGSTDVKINGVTTHLDADQAKNLQVNQVP